MYEMVIFREQTTINVQKTKGKWKAYYRIRQGTLRIIIVSSIEPQRSEGSAIIRRIPRPYKLVVAWMALHEDELAADWELISAGEPFFKIKPLD